MGVLLDGVLGVHLDPLDHETDIVGLTVAVEVWKGRDKQKERFNQEAGFSLQLTEQSGSIDCRLAVGGQILFSR